MGSSGFYFGYATALLVAAIIDISRQGMVISALIVSLLGMLAWCLE